MQKQEKNLDKIISNIFHNKPGSEVLSLDEALRRVKKLGYGPDEPENITQEIQNMLVEYNIERRKEMDGITLEEIYPLVKQTVKYHYKNLNQNSINEEDIVQNVMIKIYNGWNDFKGECRIATWVFRIVKNEVINTIIYQNRKKRKVTNEVKISDFKDDDGQMFEQETSNLEDDIIYDEFVEKVRVEINKMSSERDKKILNMILDGYEYKDICEIVGVNYPILRKVVHDAKQMNIE